jgi:hypothetical protein
MDQGFYQAESNGRTDKILQESMIGFTPARVLAIEKLRDGQFADHEAQPAGSWPVKRLAFCEKPLP